MSGAEAVELTVILQKVSSGGESLLDALVKQTYMASVRNDLVGELASGWEVCRRLSWNRR